jgi:hypothetical protein
MERMVSDDVAQAFREAAKPVLNRDGVSTGTMMGFPCLRLQGVFFASSDRETGDLIVKLPAARVKALIEDGEAIAFSPNGRTFREWARVPQRNPANWRRLVHEALVFAEA